MLTYECWKCPEQHATGLGGAISATRYGNALVHVTLFGRNVPIMPRNLFYKWHEVQSKALSKRYQTRLTRAKK